MNRFFQYLPWAASGDLASIPDTSGSGAANWTTGYGSKYSLASTDPSHLDPTRQEFNELLYSTQTELGAMQAMGVADWADTTLNGGVQYGYSKYARVAHSGFVWSSLVSSNTAEPGTDSTKWVLAATAAITAGTFSGIVSVTTTPSTLSASDAGSIVETSGSALSVIMPAIAGVSVGSGYMIVNYKATPITVSRDGTSTFNGVSGSTSAFTLNNGAWAYVIKDSASSWAVFGNVSNNTATQMQTLTGQILTTRTIYTFPHTLGVAPKSVQLTFTCVAGGGALGYSNGDVVPMPPHQTVVSSGDKGYATKWDASNIYLSLDTNSYPMMHLWNSNALSQISSGDWQANYTVTA